MSILIKDMRVPKNCGECTFLYAKDACYLSSMFSGGNFYLLCSNGHTDEYQIGMFPFKEKRVDWCPLVELPPHGDLIDRDALMKDGWLSLHKEVMRMGGYAIHELPLINPTIPVVIEKENC